LEVISIPISGRWMDEYGQAFTVEHQPGHNFAEFLRGENRLIHSVKMRSDRLVVPAAKLDIETAQSLPYPRGGLPGLRRVIIDMGVITFDDALAHKYLSHERLLSYYQIRLGEAKRKKDRLRNENRSLNDLHRAQQLNCFERLEPATNIARVLRRKPSPGTE
jgi:hypothetical protein